MEVTIENIQKWAYDKSLSFRSQDEELCLHHPEYVPTLVELAAKEDCPKQEVIKSILEHYTQWCFLQKKSEELAAIHQHLLAAKPFITTQWLVVWFVNFQYIYGIYLKPQRLTTAACDKIAQELLIGTYTQREFQNHGPLKDGALEYSAKADSFKVYFYINPINGIWKVSKYTRLFQFD